MNLNIVFEPLPGDDLRRLLEDNVVNVNFARTGQVEWFPIGFFLKSERDDWLGGCEGYVWGKWLHVRWLWVSEFLRNQGHATRLMDAAEAYAIERGATHATLETFSFQAPGFYIKRGYGIAGQLDDYPPGHTKFFLRKTLRHAEP
jgi:ribosomal protein S18 acetylase RimI-like enzyme